MMNIKMLLVENNPFISQDLRGIIEEQEAKVTRLSRDRNEVLQSFESCKPDVLLIDINLKGDYE